MIAGDAMDAMLDAAALASKEEDAMDAMLDAAALASKQQGGGRGNDNWDMRRSRLHTVFCGKIKDSRSRDSKASNKK